jgi:hypothetical protein
MNKYALARGTVVNCIRRSLFGNFLEQKSMAEMSSRLPTELGGLDLGSDDFEIW